MKYILTQGLSSGLIIPDGKQLKIDEFIFLPDFEGEQLAKHIQTEVEAQTKEEAQRKAHRLFIQFLSKLTLLDNGKYSLSGSFSIKEGQMTTTTRTIPATASLGKDGNLIKDGFEKNIQCKPLRIRPVTHYSAGINSSDPFDQFRNFYLVLELYLGSTKNITPWIKSKVRNIEMKEDQFDKHITVISWIRHKLSHPKKGRKGLDPLLISNPKHVELVQKYLPIVQKLAREIIREHEKV